MNEPRQPKPKTEEDLRRQLSRIALHLVERAKRKQVAEYEKPFEARKDYSEKRADLLYKLTARNAESLATLLQKSPVFFERQTDAPTVLLLDEEIRALLPAEFFEHPSVWIESQPSISRGYADDTSAMLPTGETIHELFTRPYDISKVKQFECGTNEHVIPVVSKRIKPTELDEVKRAREAYEAGIPTPRVLGEIIDSGNVYAFFEYIPALSIEAIISQQAQKLGFSVQEFAAIHLPISAFTEQQYKADFESQLPVQKLSREAKERLFAEWEKRKKAIAIAETTYVITTGEVPETFDEFEIFIYKHRSKSMVLSALKFHGFSSVQAYYDALQPDGLSSEDNTVRLVGLIDTMKKRAQDAIEVHAWDSKLEEAFFGFDTYGVCKHLKALCKEKRLTHNDIAFRNVLIRWDFKQNQPARNECGEVQPYLIDWELHS